MRIHLVALPHTKVSPEFCGCAYTNKVRLFIKMMRDRHDIVLYAPEGSEAEGATVVDCLSDNARIAIFGKDDPNRLPTWPSDAQSRLFNLTAAAKIMERAEQKELVLLSGGFTHKPIADLLPGMMCIESFCGYEGIFTDKVAFESYAHMHTTYKRWGINDIRWYDRVIPPFVDVDEFPHLNDGKGDYLLFVGRLIARKGLHVASQIAEASGMRLVVAGAGGQIAAVDGEWRVYGQDTEAKLQGIADYLGPVGIEERAKLMAGAQAIICPTTYSEPGGNIAIEAMMAGTPVIAPDWGVFSETVRPGVSGFHFRTLKKAVDAVKIADRLNPYEIRDYAITHYGLKAIARKFDAWFDDLQTLWADGWNTL